MSIDRTIPISKIIFNNKVMPITTSDEDLILQEKFTEENGIVTPDIGYYGLRKVTVNVKDIDLGLIDLTLPDIFAKGTVYYFQFDDDTILFTSSVVDSGVWVYHINDNIWKQLYLLSSWKSFQTINGKCLIGGSYNDNKGLLLYDPDSDTVTKIYSSGYHLNFQIIGDKCLSGWPNGTGLWMYDATTNTVQEVRSSGYWYRFKVIGNKCLISGNSASILIYDPATDTFTEHTLPSAHYTIYQKVGDNYLITGTGSNGLGVVLYRPSDCSFTSLYDLGKGWDYFQIIGNKCLIGGGSYSAGLLLYDIDSETITPLYSSGNDFKNFQMIGGKWLISSNANNTSCAGVFLYNPSDDTLTQLYTYNYAWDKYQVMSDKCLISSSSSQNGVLIYDSIDETITRAYQSGKWNTFQVVGDNCLIGCTGTASTDPSGVLLYNSKEFEIASIHSANKGWCNFEIVDNSCYIRNFEIGKEEPGKYVLLYNNRNNKTIIDKYYI